MRFILIVTCLMASVVSLAQRNKKEVRVPQTQADSLKLESVIIDAEKQLILGDYARALESFLVALELNNQSAAIHFKIAEVLYRSDQGQKALSYGLEAVELDPNNKYYMLELARIYKSVGFYIESAKTYEKLLEKFPDQENALYELLEIYKLNRQRDEVLGVYGRIEKELGVREMDVRDKQKIYMQERNVDGVVAEFKKLIDAYPNESTFKAELINFLIQNRRLDEAASEIEKYEATEPNSSRITIMKSEIAWMQGKRKEALELLEEALVASSLDFPTKFQILSNYVIKAQDQKEHNTLTKIATLLADQHPEEFKAQAFVGDMYYQNGDRAEAVGYYLKAVDIKPANFSLWQNILNIEAEMNQYDSIVLHSKRALEYFPNQALLYYFAGTGYLVQEDYKQSIRMLNQGSKYTLDPNLLTVFFGQLGDAYNGMGETEKSFGAYERALANKPGNDHVLNNYSYYLSLANRDLEKALEMSSRLVKQHPNNPTYLDTHGWVLYTLGDYKESKKFLEKAALLGEDGTVIEHLGDVLFQLGEVDAAIEQWERARDLGEASDLIEKKIADRKLYE